jgi:predicted DNA-binding protein YlxM (UPF0122 family)
MVKIRNGGATYQEIADVCGISRQAVHKRIKTACADMCWNDTTSKNKRMTPKAVEAINKFAAKMKAQFPSNGPAYNAVIHAYIDKFTKELIGDYYE